ncbi:MAG: YkgJ family cysteine cluster protein [Spirochaetales bacterium]|nr:YkgJ family cysteine cluster protein [Spirochaetales bacterium]
MNDIFYSRGLRFQCLRCSRCCRFEPGFVYLSQADLARLAAFLGVSEKDFTEQYCRTVQGKNGPRLSLREKANYDCIFWSESGCEVYEVRPFQCKSYPFWDNYLSSQEAWNALETSCPGVNNGRLFTYEEIKQWKDLKKEEIYCIPLKKDEES